MPIQNGEMLLNGKSIINASIRQRCGMGISYIPEDRQNYGLILDFDLKDNLAMKNYYRPPIAHKGVIDYEKIEKYGQELSDEYDIRSGSGCETMVRSMSGGNQQKVIIAREIAQNSDLIIFVQPTRGLDVGAIENIHKQILKEREKGKAILLISLELDEVMQLADTIAVIYNGKIQKIADAESLNYKEVGELMMGARTNE